MHEPLTRRNAIGAPRKTKSVGKISSTRCGRKCVTIKPRFSQARIVLPPALAGEHRDSDQNNDRYAEHNDARRLDHVVPHNIRSALEYLALVSQVHAASMCSLCHCFTARRVKPNPFNFSKTVGLTFKASSIA